MKRSIATLAMVLALVSGSALAKTLTATIASIDKGGDSITLSDGNKFTLPEGIEAETLKVGEKVTITYSNKGGKFLVSTIHQAK